MKTTHGRVRTWLITAAAVTGIALGAAGVAGAASGGSPAASTTPAASNAAPNPATMKNGPGETLLTGTTADKVKAAALTAVPGGTIIRVETDSAGSPYEAHVTKTDGTQVTVKVDAGFKVTATEAGFGGGPGGQAPPNGNASPNA